MLPPRMPTTTIQNHNLLQSVQKLPRHHLGSTLYYPFLDKPSSLSSPIIDKLSTSLRRLIPRFEGKGNCTFTVRVPRFYMKRKEREKICRQRALWGADVYTDDSDSLAAAMHAGWIRGDWGEGVDPSNLGSATVTGPTRLDPAVSGSVSLAVLVRPPQPIIPPPGKDLHLTLLILPALQNYASLVQHGIKSRAWGDTHDGMSFMIEKMVWVDEGAGYGEERGARARRKRMKVWHAMGSGPPMRLNTMKQIVDGTTATVVSTSG